MGCLISPSPANLTGTPLMPALFSTRKFSLVFALSLLVAPVFAGESDAPLVLVESRQPRGVIVVPDHPDPALTTLAESFCALVERSTGARLPIVAEGKEAALPPEQTRLFLGPTGKAKEAGLDPAAFKEEEYRIVPRGNALFIVGRDAVRISGPERLHPASQPTRWALNRIAEEQLGVRWLWPGKLGTYVPQHADLSVPPAEVTWQPRLESRQLALAWRLRTAKRLRPPSGHFTPEERAAILEKEAPIIQEAVDWLENHQGGERGNVTIPSHGFNHWWARYGKEHPEYFALPPEGRQPALYRPGSIKLRISNPAVLDQIVAEYRAAGAPPYWSVAPNDAAGYDTSPETLAWDLPQGLSVLDIWDGKANLTPRFVLFWNLIYERLKEINPEVTLTTLAYSAHREPPPPERPLKARVKLAIVPGYRDDAYALWKGWAEAISEGGIRLRPNWWWQGANAPHLPLREISDYIHFALKHRMDSIRMDSINGNWGTKGASYYLVARLIIRPDLSLDEVLAEYTSAFGPAALKIREYLDYWQKVTTAQDEWTSDVPEVRDYLTRVRSGEIKNLMVSSSNAAKTLPDLYPDAVLAPAQALLEEAAALTLNGDPEAALRVRFLQDGLAEVRLTRDVIALARRAEDPATADSESRAAYRAKVQELDGLRKRLGPQHVIWTGSVQRLDLGRNLPTSPGYRLSSPVDKPQATPPPPDAGEDRNDL